MEEEAWRSPAAGLGHQDHQRSSREDLAPEKDSEGTFETYSWPVDEIDERAREAPAGDEKTEGSIRWDVVYARLSPDVIVIYNTLAATL